MGNRLANARPHSAIFLRGEPLEDRRMLAPIPYLLKDINAATYGSSPDEFVIFEGLGYFEAKNQLWRTDGTPEGTERVGDFERVGGLTLWQDALWFTKQDQGMELWRSDGAVEGTVRVATLPTVQYASTEITGTSRGLFFVAREQATGNELWSSDGTAEGTRLLKDIRPGTNASNPLNVVEIGDWVYFAANDGTNGLELWKTDGTEAQTSMLRDLRPGQNGSAPTKPVELNGEAYFTAYGGFWKSDGTGAGTVQLLRSAATEASILTLNGRVLFSGNDPMTNDVGLWATDGDLTYQVVDPNPLGATTLNSFVVADGSLYFTANSGDLWRSDGTSLGTYSLGRIEGFDGTSLSGVLYGADGQLLVTASNSAIGAELWRWDGAGPSLVEDIWPGKSSSMIRGLGSYNGLFVFAAADGTHGDELWVGDGTESGTRMLKDIETRSNSLSANAEKFVDVNGITYFVARQTAYGAELWRTDGTTAGTTMVKDISPGFDDTEFGSLYNVNGKLMFIRKYYDAPEGSGADEGTEIWISDGTAAGTQRVAKLPWGDTTDIGDALAIGDTLYFTFDYDYDANEEVVPAGNELWKTDGTAAGTKLVKNIRAGYLSSDPSNFAELNGQLYFTADDGSGPDLWKSDGTTSGTVLVKRLEPEFRDSTVYNMVRADGRLFFAKRDDQWRRSLWTSDGTTSGTVKLYEVESNDSRFRYPGAMLGGRLIYSGAEPGGVGYSLMATDGTLAGTVRLGRSTSDPFVEVNGTLFYITYDEFTDQGVVWKTDGTAEGTVPAFTPEFREVSPLWNANGTLLLRDSESQIWATDGTAEQMQLVDTKSWYGGFAAGEFSYFARDFDWVRGIYPGPGPMVLRNATALVDLNGAAAEKSFATHWAGLPVAIADAAATIESSQAVLTALHVRTAQATAGVLLTADTSGTAIVATFDGTVLRLTGEDSRENYQQVLRSVRFHATGDAARLATVTLEVQAFTSAGFAVVPVKSVIELSPAVVGRHLFYNGSKFDGGSTAINAADAAAIATDKIAYLPGSGVATTASVSSYSRGINGVMIDIAGLNASLSAADFSFRMGSSDQPGAWQPAPAPLQIAVTAGAGVDGSDRVTIVWANGAIKNTWLQVIVRGNDATGGFHSNSGLAASDVFYFGNRVGDTFENATPSAALTSARDELAVRAHGGMNLPVTNPYDFNRDGIVSAADQLLARNNGGLLRMINVEQPGDESLAEPAVAADGDLRTALAFALAATELDDDPADELFGLVLPVTRRR